MNATSLKDLSVLWNVNLPSAFEKVIIHELCTDTRKIVTGKNSLFVALKGPHFNGHSFVRKAYDLGIRIFVCDEAVSLPSDCYVIQVSNTLEAIQSWAKFNREGVSIPIVAITGSNGKTIVKEWLNTLLAKHLVVQRSPKSFNSQLGVALSLLNLSSNDQVGLIEAGISHENEMQHLANMIFPELGIFTFLGQAHLENFNSVEDLIQQKCLLFASCKKVILPNIHSVIEHIKKEYPSIELIVCGYDPTCSLQIVEENKSENHTFLQLRWKNELYPVQIPFVDQASISNFTLALAGALQFNISIESLLSSCKNLCPLEMRLEQLRGKAGMTILNDSYSNDLTSLELALSHFHQQFGSKKIKRLILSELTETQNDNWKLEVKNLLAKYALDEVHLVGSNWNNFNLEIPTTHYANTSDFIHSLSLNNWRNSAVLIKGARVFEFERIVRFMQEQHHETVFEVNLNALEHNVHYFRSLLNPKVEIMGMVKAGGYGIGAVEVANQLIHCGVQRLAVAYTDEGVQLREAGISVPILVLEPNVHDFEPLFRYRLEPELFSLESFERYAQAARQEKSDITYHVHIKLDTGMNRLGFKQEDDSALIELIRSNSHLKIVSLFTHFAASEDEQFDSFTRGQLQEFQTRTGRIRESCNIQPLLHAANTGGIQRWLNAQFNIVRLGIGMYGVSAFEEEQRHLKTVGSLKTAVVQIKKVRAGESVGYGRSFIAQQEMTIAVIPIGYADGFRRSLSNGIGHVVVAGQLCPVVGKVCMDVTMIDISGLQVVVGDEVEIFGNQQSIQSFAQQCNTIAYEVLTSIPMRVKRSYLLGED
ncbi:MAG: bifunctional UDP-N-acetylmuramoyl-tripeptide:D-alanyl-D-alanine ligase/alanine racemase [Bacteroidetes bacterium]|nr:bifunctional UDP-N-acetylmuramoyl-tripeptide:D-alanyl-D-alanine ligase/alanine racemase [Bacteroidota bacterium]